MRTPSLFKQAIWISALAGFVVSGIAGALVIFDVWAGAMPLVIAGGGIAIVAAIGEVAHRMSGGDSGDHT